MSVSKKIIFLVVFYIPLAFDAPAKAVEIKQFYGTWVSSDYNNKACKKIDGEVAGIAIYKDQYVPLLGGFCEDVNMFMRGDTLFISANCFSDEAGGHSAITNTFKLVAKNSLRMVQGFDRERNSNNRFLRCLDCKPDDNKCVFGE